MTNQDSLMSSQQAFSNPEDLIIFLRQLRFPSWVGYYQDEKLLNSFLALLVKGTPKDSGIPDVLVKTLDRDCGLECKRSSDKDFNSQIEELTRVRELGLYPIAISYSTITEKTKALFQSKELEIIYLPTDSNTMDSPTNLQSSLELSNLLEDASSQYFFLKRKDGSIRKLSEGGKTLNLPASSILSTLPSQILLYVNFNSNETKFFIYISSISNEKLRIRIDNWLRLLKVKNIPLELNPKITRIPVYEAPQLMRLSREEALSELSKGLGALQEFIVQNPVP